MKMPRYIKVHSMTILPDGTMDLVVTVRRWHPGYWIAKIKHLFR